MKKTILSNGRAIFLGLGSESHALLVWLHAHSFNEPITVWDPATAAKLGKRYASLKRYKNISWQLGSKRLPNLIAYDTIVRSPGIFISSKERHGLKDRITCPMHLFLTLCPTKNTIGVSGTKGKGTTSSLITTILKQGGKRVWLAGNIGKAPFEYMDKIKANDWVVLELSSYQLQDMTSSPHIAALTNFSREHLASYDPDNANHHESLSAYWQAKLNLLRFQKKSDLAIVNIKLKSRLKNFKPKGKRLYFTKSTLHTELAGEHNKENIAAAEIVAKHIGIKAAAITKAVAKFKGLEYRLEKIAVKNGITYYNDSFATTPTATITALKSFAQPVILMAGGSDKGSSFEEVAGLIAKKTKAITLFKGTGTPKLRKALIQAKYKFPIKEVSSMKQALAAARSFAKPGDTILLSPACASFTIFKNYKDRGKQFTEGIKKLTA